jgi:hypothetical protein
MVSYPVSPGFFEYHRASGRMLERERDQGGASALQCHDFLVKKDVPFMVAGRYAEGAA